ncbi:MAG: Na+/H+ antiporter subunit E [Burkholderiales bacterium]|nr:Na+/H+ antiporter subunit E [Burkholderiales bacterium]
MLQLASLGIVLYAFWILLSGYFEPFLLGAGAGSALVVVLLARRMKIVDREGHPIQMIAAVVLYWPWLFKEIAKCAWEVSRIILDPRLPISPVLVRFKPSQKSQVGLATHANSITLTPGTITVEAAHNEFLVHGLTRASGAGVIDSEMDRRVTRVEGYR